MTNKTTDALQAAIKSLGAVEVAPDKYAVPTCDPPQHVGSAAAIIAFANGDDSGMVPMPAFWTPDARFASRCPICGILAKKDDFAAHVIPNGNHVSQRITADLATGEEVPA